MNTYYRIHLPNETTVEVSYHDQSFPIARFLTASQRYQVLLPPGSEARIVPDTEFHVETVSEGAAALLLEPLSSPKSPPGAA